MCHASKCDASCFFTFFFPWYLPLGMCPISTFPQVSPPPPRVNPWCSESVAEGIHSATRMSIADRLLRHEKHWRYISQHTVMYWAQSFLRDLQQQTLGLEKMHCIMLGLGLKTFKTYDTKPTTPCLLTHVDGHVVVDVTVVLIILAAAAIFKIHDTY